MTPTKLIALDLDGTLLDRHRRISPRNHQALARARALGIPVVLCSGRYYAGVRLIAQQAHTHDLLICGNGAQVTTAAGDTVFSRYLSLETTRTLASLAEGLGLRYSIYADETLMSAWAHEVFRYYQDNGCPVRLLPAPFPEDLHAGSRILKIEIHGRFTPDQAQQLRSTIEGMSTVIGEGDYISSVECHDPTVSKGTGLVAAAAHYGVPMENVLAVGNAENDISMVEMAGHGVAVGNAVQALKDVAARIVAGSEEDGVAQAVEWYCGQT